MLCDASWTNKPTPPWTYDPAAPDGSLVSFSPPTCELDHSSCNTDWATAQSPTGTPGRVWTEGRVLTLTNKPSISSWSDKTPQRPVTQSSDCRDRRGPSVSPSFCRPSETSVSIILHQLTGKVPMRHRGEVRPGVDLAERGKRVERRKEIRKSSDLQGWNCSSSNGL